MDPFLEPPALCPGVHQAFITYARATLNSEGAYARRIDYRREPTPPLQGDDVMWADQVLRDRGLRP
jgi:hypothetical protein